jgi:hypothetical protein
MLSFIRQLYIDFLLVVLAAIYGMQFCSLSLLLAFAIQRTFAIDFCLFSLLSLVVHAASGVIITRADIFYISFKKELRQVHKATAYPGYVLISLCLVSIGIHSAS